MTTEAQALADESRLRVIEAVLPHLATKEDVALIPYLATKEEIAILPQLATKEEMAMVMSALPHLATREEVSRITAVIPHLATKEDVAKLETRLVETKNETLRWTVGAIAVATAILGLLTTLTG